MADQPNQPHAFDGKSIRKVARVVRDFHKIYRDKRGEDVPRAGREAFWARVTGSEASGDTFRHTAVEVVKTESGGDSWTDRADGRQAAGATNGVYLYAADRSQLDDDAIVWVEVELTRDGAGSQVVEWWGVRGGGGAEDAPEYYGQVHMGTANLTAGWSLLPLVNIVP